MDIKQLHTFETIIQTGSFQKAAQVLSYAPSTITFQMKQLEKELGVSLFERRGHEQRLTSAGISLKPYVDQVLHSADQLVAHAGMGHHFIVIIRVPHSKNLFSGNFKALH